ncbi:LCP family protein [Haloechinothrix sp. LS1_15]|uniref:LCP family protein n=1 Tax=Haloechinothrix sp. LS1_15 TaxID=2652248 RepID=UPI002948B65C|nr:LCP family protein [Haloechinothrix sp. LS1_15]MDV6011233.1 LytR family transcriptional regulator [Haloechinothrix sp. LS1_15]
MADSPATSTPRPRRGRRLLVITLVTLLVLGGGAVAGLYLVSNHLAGNVERVPSVFEPLDEAERPEPPAGEQQEARTFLLVGTDSRAEEPTTGADAENSTVEDGGVRSDVIMLLRLSADRESAAVVSVPRDSWVHVPGHGMAKVNAAYAFGGASLLVHTLESLTDIRIDHFAVIDFAGFESLTDAVGGITVNVAETTSHEGVTFEEGQNHLDGEEALVYVRQRYELPRGDLDRVQRHQAVMRELLGEALSEDTMRSPRRAYTLVDTATDWVSVDDTLSNGDMRSLAWGMRSMRTGDVTFLTAPVSGLGREGAQSVVYLDEARAAQLWEALNDGEVERYAAENEDDVLGDDVR